MSAVRRPLCVVTWPGFDPDDADVRRLFGELDAEVAYRPKLGARTPDELAEIMKGASAAVASTDPFDRTVLARLPTLRVIARTGVGVDTVDVDAATEFGVVVARTGGAHEDVVADHTLALMLAAVRRIVENDASVRGGRWERAGDLTPAALSGSCVGLVGVGRIGSAVARRLIGFGCDVIAYDPVVEAAPGVTLVTLQQVFMRADIVSLHVPLTPDTRGLVDARCLAGMRPGSILVNAARGGLVDEVALVAALASGRLRAAALDVFADEPPLTPGLLELANIVLSPHIAGFTRDSVRELTVQAVTAAMDVLAGRPNPGIVNPEALGHPR